MLTNTTDGYGLIARLFHWIVFLMVLGVIIGGNVVADMPSGPSKADMIALHKSFGFTVLTVMVLRLIWRLANPRPRDLGTHPVENRLGHAMHIGLYILLLVQPAVGILMSQALGFPVMPFHLFSVPTILSVHVPLGKLLLEIHETIGGVLAVCIGLHAAAALKHHFMDKDRTLVRMIVGR